MGRFLKSEDGNVTILTAVFLPVLFAGGIMAMDHANTARYKILLQDAADAAALASAKELGYLSRLEGVDLDREIDRVAQSYVDLQLTPTQKPARSDASIVGEGRVRVHAWREIKPILGELYGARTMVAEAYSTAEALGAEDLCMLLTWTDNSKHVLHLDQDAEILAEGCMLHANSRNEQAVELDGKSVATVGTICSAGGIKVSGNARIDGNAVDTCPRLDDPLEMHSNNGGPISSLLGTVGCMFPHEIEHEGPNPFHLMPGRYCDDVVLSGDADVTLAPGDYTFTGGELRIEDDAVVKGEDVALVFAGDSTGMSILDDADVSLSGRTAGDFAGMLIVSRQLFDGSQARKFRIESPRVKELVGTILTPDDDILIDTDAPVGEGSAFTIVVTRTLQVKGQAKLVLNRDYGLTSVPVPGGFEGAERSLRLIE